MKISALKKNKWIRFFSNKYVLILIFFIVWMVFFDTNSYFIHKELNDDIETLQKSKQLYQKDIKEGKEFLQKMEDSNEMEKYAREKFYLKKENEDIYIIEHEDSIPKNKQNE
ncbi:MAG TPA: septum formation initiator family protein [Flavobacteriaceae bacterium]|nr:septum formation initiator family protein [Flavobacteriaceae bacterium]MCB9212453.1 septum formation initiator family protein [Alteromonas sp.]HPF11729.1 septum formation initiator family protein [Flavobacteriaceae bacterium]HQU20204.1 septum formation initiator family protein [Flavobacteriaceae bacterium]HQU64707.1 septum formation initiator family protein [Flavobacteriaceae bacterium]